ncbi:MAG: mandelate racemase/muconate lactonizing enzyme family protein [Pseudomonadota bacterium]
MKITKITTHRLRVPTGDKAFFSSQAMFPERNSCLVRIETDQGLTGWGEGGQWGPGEPVAAVIDQVLGPRLVGRDPTEPVRLWEENYVATRDFGQKGAYIDAISALDIACWDLAGQACGLPVWKLLGGRFRDRVQAYATGCYYPTDYADTTSMMAKLRAEVEGYAGAGFGLIKVKIGLLPLEQDVARIAMIREVLGPEMAIMVDANHAYNAGTAVRMAHLMAPYDIRFFEEPVVPEDRDGYRKVRAETSIPVAGGECEFTRYGFRDLIGGGCVDIVQPDLAACGGFTAFRDILTLAACHGVSVVPHVWGSGVAVTAALHAIATIPLNPHSAHPVALQNAPVIEFDRTHNPLRDDLLEQPFVLENGALRITEMPGLGQSVREDQLAVFEVGTP